MDPKSDLLQVALQWLGTRGLLGLFLATFTTLLRAMLGFDETRRQLALSFAAALFVIGFVAPGASELLALRPEGSLMIGAILGLTARLLRVPHASRHQSPPRRHCHSGSAAGGTEPRLA